MNNYNKGLEHIDYVKKYTPPSYGIHETGSGSTSCNDIFNRK